MSIITNNTGTPYPANGGAWAPMGFVNGPYYQDPSGKGQGNLVNITISPQIVGLVPVFPCTSVECREGKYAADQIPDDTMYQLPVFAQNPLPAGPLDPYFNDFNSFLFDFPNANTLGTGHTFYLDKLINGVWTQEAILNDNTYGTYYGLNSLCSAVNWQGYNISWQKVLALLGTGAYRFRMNSTNWGIGESKYTQCWASPGFCLAVWDCRAVDRTTKWEVTYNGGKIGSIDKTGCGGNSWTFCCNVVTSQQQIKFAPIVWNDSIRFESFFGKEQNDYEMKNIKFQTGFVNRIRTEEILKFTMDTGQLPFWIHQRFKSYGMLADTIKVSDYNINNTDYNLNRFCVVPDGSYNIDYKGYTRYPKAHMSFKSQIQFIMRNRCC
jgi:hypothetical protein